MPARIDLFRLGYERLQFYTWFSQGDIEHKPDCLSSLIGTFFPFAKISGDGYDEILIEVYIFLNV